MNKQKFFRVIDLIDEDIVREAEIKAEALTDAENEKAMTVSGVEKYRKITWQRTAAIASAVLLIAGVGTGGTLSGVGKYLKEQNPNVKVVAVEPETSPVLSKGEAGAHKIQGIGAGFVPDTLNTDIYDEIIAVPNEAAFETGNKIAKTEGVLVGISSGAAVWAATRLAKKEENKGKNIVVILPDTGDRYLSTPLFS